MAARFEDLIEGMVNIGFGVAATATEHGRAMIRDLNEKGERVRSESSGSGLSRSISDAFEQAGGVFSDVTARLGSTGDAAAERVLFELILARVRPMDPAGRIAFIEHVRALVNSVDDHVTRDPMESAGTCRSEGDAGPARGDDAASAGSRTTSRSVPISGADAPGDERA